MKGFKDSSGKFHPITKYKAVRKSRDKTNKTKGVRIRKERREPPKIKKINYFGEPSMQVTKMKPEEFLDKASSSGLEHTMAKGEKHIEHNKGIISDLGGVHSTNPKLKSSMSRDDSQNDWFTEEGQNTLNKILGTGKDERPEHRIYDKSTRAIFRGDELGTIEFLKRQIRHGLPIERPMFSVDAKGRIQSHEGRHRSRAFFEEGVPDVEVKLFAQTEKDAEFFAEFPNLIQGQRNSLKDFMNKIERSERTGVPLEVEYYSPETENMVKKYVKITPELKRQLLEMDTRSPIT